MVAEARSALSDAMPVNLESISCEGITKPGIHIMSGAMHVNLEAMSSVPSHNTRKSHGCMTGRDADGFLGWCMVQWYECAWRYDMVGTCGIHTSLHFLQHYRSCRMSVAVGST